MEPSKPATEAAAPAVETKVEAPAAAAEVKKETIGEALSPQDKQPEAKVVPEAAFLDMKKDNKEDRKEIKALRDSIEGGATKSEVSADISEIGEKYGVDKAFLSELAGAIRKGVEEETDAKIKPLTAKDKAEQIDRVFSKHYDAAMAEMPEFADVADRDVIKTLSLSATNKDKTFQQLIEETYGKAIRGKRTLETTTPRGGRAPEGIDFTRAAKDPAYYDQIMADPALKKEYNSSLTDRLSASL